MKPIAVFGVGCFHFGMELDPPYRIRPSEYANAIEDSLRDLDTVDDFSVSRSPLASDEELDLTEHAFSMLHGETDFSGYIRSVEFSLRIPQRVQEDIVRAIHWPDYRWQGLGTDRFMVRTRYFYYGPVTVVECLDVDDNGHADPSDAVYIVREYLKQKLEESEKDIRLECVGPSPFHADFFVFDARDTERPHAEYKEQRGYDVASILVPAYVSDDRVAWVLEWVGRRLSFYYLLKRLNMRQAEQWSQMDGAWRSLIGSPSSGRALARIGTFMRKRRAITSLVDGVLGFEAARLSTRQGYASVWKSIESENDDLDFLDNKVKGSFEETFRAYPTSQVLELAKFYETRDSKWRDRLHVLLAAVIGGAVGAILTQLSTAP